MHAEETRPNSSPTPSPNPSARSEVPTSEDTSGIRPGFRLPLWLLTLGAGLAAGLISWAGGEATLKLFRIEDEMVYPPNYKQISGYQKQNLTAQLQGDAIRVVERKKAAVSFGLLGLLLGVCLGLAGGFAGGSTRTTVLGAVAGGIAGAVAGGRLVLRRRPPLLPLLRSRAGAAHPLLHARGDLRGSRRRFRSGPGSRIGESIGPGRVRVRRDVRCPGRHVRLRGRELPGLPAHAHL